MTSSYFKKSGAVDRRAFLQAGIGAAALGMFEWARAATGKPAKPWNPGQVLHLIPTANHQRFLIKASFQSAMTGTPWLIVNGRRHGGVKTDQAGRFWRFDVHALRPDTRYELRLTNSRGAPLCDAWPLQTFPTPEAQPEHLRILAYTCAGGYDGALFKGKTTFLDMAVRQRLLRRGLAFQPDTVIANGDHIYWDIKTLLNRPFAKFVREEIWNKFGGAIDISVPMNHPRNIGIFTRVCDYQIAGLYGTVLRSTPSFFLADDHDMFENDEFDANLATLPADTYGTLGAELTQGMYYPEFLPDANRPLWLPGGDKAGMPEGCNGNFGTLRYGKLLETVLYDCRRFLDYKGIHAKVIPQWAEDWIIARTRAEDTIHFMHSPSLPFAYSSGKLGDWYPDLLDEKTGKLTMEKTKDGWQSGWFAQHQRLLAALAEQQQRAAVIIQGDFHAVAAGRILRSGDLALAQPIHIIMTGPLGTGDLAFPSAVRSIESTPALELEMEQVMKPVEKNGFTIIDVTPEKIKFSIFIWRPPQEVEEIDTLQPALVYEVPRKSRRA